jgi:hypothetical protein
MPLYTKSEMEEDYLNDVEIEMKSIPIKTKKTILGSKWFSEPTKFFNPPYSKPLTIKEFFDNLTTQVVENPYTGPDYDLD